MVEPRTFMVAVSTPYPSGVKDYLDHTGQGGYWDEFFDGGLVVGSAVMCSMGAKMCYKSLEVGHNANITRVRKTFDNLQGIIDSGHGSVMEHISFTFITTGCSRIFTHELVRHRAGTAFSQTSGRYVRLDNIEVVVPPELQDCQPEITDCLGAIEQFVDATERRVGLQGLDAACEAHGVSPGNAQLAARLGFVENPRTREFTLPFAVKKKLASAIRRLAPNGQPNEIMWTANWRALRHMIEMRSSRHAEWEIRKVFNDVVDVAPDWVVMGGKERTVTVSDVDGLREWVGLKV